jgi:hypothetical protein
MLPALDGARRRLFGHAAGTQRTAVAVGLAADIPDLDAAAGVDLAAFRRLEKLVIRTAVGIRFGVVDELFMGDAAFHGA